jgi:hypothetical protein
MNNTIVFIVYSFYILYLNHIAMLLSLINPREITTIIHFIIIKRDWRTDPLQVPFPELEQMLTEMGDHNRRNLRRRHPCHHRPWEQSRHYQLPEMDWEVT